MIHSKVLKSTVSLDPVSLKSKLRYILNLIFIVYTISYLNTSYCFLSDIAIKYTRVFRAFEWLFDVFENFYFSEELMRFLSEIPTHKRPYLKTFFHSVPCFVSIVNFVRIKAAYHIHIFPMHL